jgi:hypothetical protein
MEGESGGSKAKVAITGPVLITISRIGDFSGEFILGPIDSGNASLVQVLDFGEKICHGGTEKTEGREMGILDVGCWILNEESGRNADVGMRSGRGGRNAERGRRKAEIGRQARDAPATLEEGVSVACGSVGGGSVG